MKCLIRPRISITAAMAVVAGIATFLGLWTDSARQQKAAVQELNHSGNGFGVYYDYEITNDLSYDPSGKPHLLAKYLGVDYFHSVAVLDFRKSALDPDLPKRFVAAKSTLRDPDAPVNLKPLANLRRVRRILLSGSRIQTGGLRPLEGQVELSELRGMSAEVRDADLRYLATCRNVRRLELANTPVTDEGVRYLVGLRQLEYLDLSWCNITDESVPALASLPQLRLLLLSQTQLTDEGAALLRERLPQTEVHCSRPSLFQKPFPRCWDD